MKTSQFALLASLSALALAPLAHGAACCPPPEPAPKPSCCAAEAPASEPASIPLSARSIYLLDSTWTNDAGAPVTLAMFRGQPVILAMFFAQCDYACPVLVNDIRRLRAALPAAARRELPVVLVSFDPKRDTPAALRAYRERAQLDANWTLLHGDAGAVQDLAMLLGIKFKADARGQFAHSNLFTLLNAEGEIARQQLGLNGDISETAKAAASLIGAH